MTREVWVGWAVLLVVSGAAEVRAAPALTELPITSVSSSFSEEEGGGATYEYFSSGWMHFSGRKSCCGYKPPLANGWYRVSPVRAQEIFDAAAREVALGHFSADGAAQDRQGSTSVLLDDGRHLALTRYGVDLDASRGLSPPVQKQPKDWNRRKYLGHHLSSITALRALHDDPEEAAKLTAPEVAQVLAELRREQRTDEATAARTRKLLARLPDGSVGEVAAMLLGGRPPCLRVADVMEVLGEHRAAARPAVAAIAGGVTDDATLVAATIALGRIGGPEADRHIVDQLLPRLAEAPREQALPIYYRLEFARALRTLDSEAARKVLSQRVYPPILQHLQTTTSNHALSESATALAVFQGRPEEAPLRAADEALFVRLLRSSAAADRRIAAEQSFRRHAKQPPAAIRQELERLRSDPDGGVRSWVEQSLK